MKHAKLMYGASWLTVGLICLIWFGFIAYNVYKKNHRIHPRREHIPIGFVDRDVPNVIEHNPVKRGKLKWNKNHELIITLCNE